MGIVYVVGTCDTKAPELLYAKQMAERAGARAVLVDVGTRPGGGAGVADVSAAEVADAHPGGTAVLGGDDRGRAVAAMAEALSAWLGGRDDIGAVLGLGGSGNTAIVTQAMRALPAGMPKLMVSTVASGNVAPYVGPTDIAMMYSVVDVAGLNASAPSRAPGCPGSARSARWTWSTSGRGIPCRRATGTGYSMSTTRRSR